MKQTLLTVLILLLTVSFAQAQIKLGVKAALNVPAGRTVLFGSDTTGSTTEYYSPKLIWYGSKGAFRAGGLTVARGGFNAWDKNRAGNYSFASGLSTMAIGEVATSMGQSTTALGENSTSIGFLTLATGQAATSMGERTIAGAAGATSMGYETIADGVNATSLGMQSKASGATATSMGYQSKASGNVATSMGHSTIASGNHATSLGYRTLASGDQSISAGASTTASGTVSFAIGTSVSTNGMIGSFILGDYAPDIVYANTAANQMMMRFRGGYILYTSSGPYNPQTAVGVQLSPNANAWQTVSDSSRKENFRSVDGDSFLYKIGQMRLGSWNYKGQNPHQYRHWGPMAQDFYAAFGHDSIGVIGEEKLINQADFDGVNLIAIQALVRQLEQLKAELTQMKDREKNTQARLDKLEALFIKAANLKSVSTR